MLPVQYCPSLLYESLDTYSSEALEMLFDGVKVSHILDFESPQYNDDILELFLAQRSRISVSGVQEKISLRLKEKKLVFTEKNEQGTFILKPIPYGLKKNNDIPANEHLTMQIAAQVFGIETAVNALIFFKEGVPAYITKRFDVINGEKIAVEDFATLAGKTEGNSGKNYKYDFSYEKLGILIKQYSSEPQKDSLIFVRLLLFNFLFSNGDAHLRNFSLIEKSPNHYRLSPAYDLLNTRIHVADTNFALRKGLFENKDAQSAIFRQTGQPTKNDFILFAEQMGISKDIVLNDLALFFEKQNQVKTLVNRSFLSESSKNAYLIHYNTKVNQL